MAKSSRMSKSGRVSSARRRGQLRSARPPICAAGSFGLAWKSKPSMVVASSKWARRSRRGHGHRVTAGDLVLAEDLQEVEVAEFPGGGLSESGVEGLEHAGEFQGAQTVVQRDIENGHELLFSG